MKRSVKNTYSCHGTELVNVELWPACSTFIFLLFLKNIQSQILTNMEKMRQKRDYNQKNTIIITSSLFSHQASLISVILIVALGHGPSAHWSVCTQQEYETGNRGMWNNISISGKECEILECYWQWHHLDAVSNSRQTPDGCENVSLSSRWTWSYFDTGQLSETKYSTFSYVLLDSYLFTHFSFLHKFVFLITLIPTFCFIFACCCWLRDI